MTMLQADCARPERCVVGHPFNPPYLIPLVEVVGGERTEPRGRDLAEPTSTRPSASGRCG